MEITKLECIDDFHVADDPQTGNVILHLKNHSQQQAIGLAMQPLVSAALVEDIVKCLLTSPQRETKAAGQIVGIRDISAQMRHPSLLTLRYELELGVELETTIEIDTARRLRDELDSAILAFEEQPPPTRQ